MTVRNIYEKILKYEQENGESFIEEFDSNINPISFMFWCYGRGYITREKFLLWEDNFTKKKISAHCLNTYLYNEDGKNGPNFSIINSDEYNNDDYETALSILSNFIYSSNTYLERFNKFMKGM